MSRYAKLPVGYSLFSLGLSSLVLLLMLVNHLAMPSAPAFHDLLFFVLVAAYLNCLPLAIVSIYLFFKRKDLRRYCLFNFAAIVVVLFFAVKVFGNAL